MAPRSSACQPNAARRTALAVLLATLAAAPGAAELAVVAPGAARVEAIGFSVQPPAGEHWFAYRHLPAGQVAFRKDDPSWRLLPGGERIRFVVEIKAERYADFDLADPEQLRAALRYALDQGSGSERPFTPLARQGSDCLHYVASREQADNDGSPLRQTVEGYFCRHPEAPHVAVTSLFQVSHPPATPSPLTGELRREAGAVLDSLRYRPLD